MTGPMVGAIVLGVNELRLSVPPLAYQGAQALIGSMVSASITSGGGLRASLRSRLF